MGIFATTRKTLFDYLSRLTALSQESLGTGEGDNPFDKKPFTIERRDDLAFDAFTLAMKRFRRIGFLWTSAGGIGSPEDRAEGQPYSPAQIIYPPWREAGDEEQIQFIRWQFDERLSTQGMGSTLDHISDTCLENGHAIVELEWVQETGGKYPGKAVIQDFHVHDPAFFVLNPKGLPPGIYLKRYSMAYTVGLADRLDDDRFKVITLHKRYGNQYGISEFQLVDQALRYFWTIYEYHARGVERSGVGAYIATTSKNLVGAKLNQFIQSVKEIRSNTVTYIPDGNKIEQLPTDISVDAFDKLEKLCLSIVSLVGTGSATTFFENQFGTYGEKQAVDVAEKSDLEIASASLLSEFFSYHVISLLMDKNFADVSSYPSMQIVEPDLIQPTLTQEKKELIEVQQDGKEESHQDGEEKEFIQHLSDSKRTGESEYLRTVPTENGFYYFKNKIDPFPTWVSTIEDVDEKESQSSDDTMFSGYHADKFIYFADMGEPEDVEPKNITTFPIQAPAPDIYNEVADAAEKYLRSMPVLPKKEYKNLGPDEKHNVFTVSAVGSIPAAAQIIEALRDAIAGTITETNEAKAWPLYKAAAQKIYRGSGVTLTDADLIPSWRFARQKAYNAGIEALIDESKGSLFAVRYHTQDDNRVRHTHKMFHLLTRPADDPIWEKLILPLGFGCRCWKELISVTMQEAEPDKYRLTPVEDIPKNIPAPFKEGYEPEEEDDEEEG